MFFAVILFVSLFLSFVVDGKLENIFIIISTMLFYKVFLVEKSYKEMIFGLFISFFLVNFLIVFGVRDYVFVEKEEPTTQKNETIVLLVSEGEDKNYNIREKATQIYEEDGYKSFFTSIQKLNEYKNYYTKNGNSNFKKKTEQISKKLSHDLGKDYMVVNSYLFSKPYLEQIIEVIISGGYKNIIICPLFMTNGSDYEVFLSRIEKMNLPLRKIVGVKVLKPFFDSEKIVEVYKNDILSSIRKLNEDAGVLLVGFEDKNDLEQDIILRQNIEKAINNEKENLDIQIKLPLLENEDEDIIKSAEEMLEYGIHSLYVVTPTTLIDTMYTKNLVESIFFKLELGYTDFSYLNPEQKIDAIVESIIEKINNKEFRE